MTGLGPWRAAYHKLHFEAAAGVQFPLLQQLVQEFLRTEAQHQGWCPAFQLDSYLVRGLGLPEW
jgi:hypothetical protein